MSKRTPMYPLSFDAESDAADPMADAMLQAASDIGVLKTWSRSQVLHWSGDHPNSVLYVRKGRLRARRFDSEGHEQILSWFGPGSVVAIAPVLAGKPFQFDIVADSSCRVLHVERARFEQMLKSDAAIATAVARLVSERLNFVMESHALQSNVLLAERVWFRLVRLAQQARAAGAGAAESATSIEVTQQQLADAVGASRYRVGQELQQLALRGLIKLFRGRIEVRAGLTERRIGTARG